MILLILLLPMLVLLFLVHRILQHRPAVVVASDYYAIRHVQLRQFSAQNGKFYAIRGGHDDKLEQYITSDPRVASELFGREQFPNFVARKGPLPAADTGHVFIAHKARWRELRKRVSLFSGRHLNKLRPLLQLSVDQMLGEIGSKSEAGKTFDFHRLSVLLSASIIARIAFLTVHPGAGPEQCPSDYVRFAQQLLQAKERKRLLRDNGEQAPRKTSFWNKLSGRSVPNTKDEEIHGIPQRELFAELHAHIVADEESVAIPIVREDDIDGDAVVDEDGIAAQLGKIFLDGSMKVVGIETVGHALALIVCLLAEHPVVQHQLRLQLLESESEDGDGEEPPLLVATIRETLRLYPIVAFASSRLCCADTVLRTNGARIGVGDSVELDMFSMGRAPEVWGPDADQFRPERWLGEKGVPANWRDHWLPFGTGTRSCIGVPLALALLKMATVAIFRRFRITPAPAEAGGHTLKLVGADVLWPEEVMIRADELVGNRIGKVY